MSTGYTSLCVPPWDQREALAKGARHSPTRGFHLLLHDNPYDFLEWLPRKYDPRAKTPFLIPDMVPSTTWGDNVRSAVSEARGDELRRYTYAASGYRCEACGSDGQPHVEAHELWKFLEQAGVQKLVRLVCLCPLCHKSKHLGFANRMGILPEVHAHLKWLNQWDDAQLATYLADAKLLWEWRSQRSWQVDLSWLSTVGDKGRP